MESLHASQIAVVTEHEKVVGLVEEAAAYVEPAVTVKHVGLDQVGASILILFDAPSGDVGATEVASHVRCSRTPIALLTSQPTVDDAVASMRAGSSGYLATDVDAAHLGASLRQLLAGRVVLDPLIGGELLQAIGRSPALTWSGMASGLSRREGEVLDLLRRGLTNREIAEHLVVGTQTVKSHVHRIYRKLGVTGRCDLSA